MLKPLICLLLLFYPLEAPPLQELFHETRPAMGTTFAVYLYAPDQTAAEELFELAFQETERIEAALSNYRPTSELSRINRLAGSGPVTTDPEVFGLIERSLELSRRTAGAFDITVGPLMKAWGFFRGRGRLPSEGELARARAGTGWRFVELDRRGRTIRFLHPEIELDLGAIGKGYALDRVAAVLRAQGTRNALVSAGQSSYAALGAPPNETGWPVHVPNPIDQGERLSTIFLNDRSLSTSGSTEKFFTLEGRKYCHIIDPRSGYPVEEVTQVTVLFSSAEVADALSTSLFVLGPDTARSITESYAGASVLMVTRVEGAVDRTEVVALDWPGKSYIKAREPLPRKELEEQ
jgi:thiamine biosynthesis lipoprotein